MTGIMRRRDDRHLTGGPPAFQSEPCGRTLHVEMQSELDRRSLQAEIVDALRQDGRVDVSTIALSNAGGLVVLNGIVHTYAEKCWCEEIVKRVPGVKAVRNELEVRLTIGDYRTDATLERIIRDLLDSLVAIPEPRLQVAVRDSWVTLEGTVRQPFQKQLVEDVIRLIGGVRGIENRIDVVPLLRESLALQS